MDPDLVIETIWKDGAVQIKDSDFAAIKDKIKQGLKNSTEGAKLSLEATRANFEGTLKLLGCQEGLDLLA